MKKSPVAIPDSGATNVRRLKIGKNDLDRAAEEGLISTRQADELWSRFTREQAGKPGFDLANLAWYSGAAIVMIAMGWFMIEVWDLYSGGAALLTAAAYAVLFFVLGARLFQREDLRVPGGVLITLGVGMVPVTVFAVERVLGLWEPSAVGWQQESVNLLIMELSAVVSGLVALRFARFPFITAPVTLAAWLAVMQSISLVAGPDMPFAFYRQVTLAFGALMIAGSYLVDRRSKDDYAFWGYLVGASAFWWSLTLMDSGSELGRFAYALVNAALMVFSVLVGRRVFTLYGAMGVIWYLGYLAFSVFADSMAFPIVLSLMGLGVIFLGIKYHRNRERIERFVLGLVPESLKPWLPQSRG